MLKPAFPTSSLVCPRGDHSRSASFTAHACNLSPGRVRSKCPPELEMNTLTRVTHPPHTPPPFLCSRPYRQLLAPQVHSHLCKLVYADEWARSIEESHAPSPALYRTLETHWREVETIAEVLAPVLAHIDDDMTAILEAHSRGDVAPVQRELEGLVRWL